MKPRKRILAGFLSLVMLFAVLPAMNLMGSPMQTASAATPPAVFTATDFSVCYTKVLLAQAGKKYGDGGGSASGYSVGGKYYQSEKDLVTSGTPYNPQTVSSQTLDCFGLVITSLMAMGYDYFIDDNGKKYPLNAYFGGAIFDNSSGWNKSLLYDHKSGDLITLHHSNNSLYDVKFELGEINAKSKNTEENILPGSLLFSLDVNVHSGIKSGPFSVHQIKSVTHAAAALFYLPQDINDTITKDNQGSFTKAQKDQILATSWQRAYDKLESIVGASAANNVVGTVKRNDKNGTERDIPKLWDARSRGYDSASSTDYKSGFIDGWASFGFNTPYNEIWQIEAINPMVSVNNNPFGKTDFIMSVSLNPVHERGSVTITKKDDKTGAVLTGASFDLYEWSTSKGQFVKSTLYHIAEDSTKAGTYRVYDSANKLAEIEFTAENAKTIKVMETKAPDGYQGNWSEEHTFIGDGEVKPWEVTAFNLGIKIGVAAHKTGYNNTNLSGAKFTLYSNEACTTTAADANGVSVFTSGTNGNTGVLTFTLCSNAQTYYLKETTVPTGYLSDGAIYRLTIAKASTGTIQIDKKIGTGSWTAVQTISAANAKALSAAFGVNNEVIPVGFTVVKKDNNNAVLQGAIFTVYTNEACTSQYGTYTTNTSGKAPIEFKPCNESQTFYMKETTAPTGYILSKDIYKIVVNGASNPSIQLYKKAEGESDYTGITTITAENAWKESYELGIRNDVHMTGFSLVKKGSNNVVLPNATFTLYSNEACTNVVNVYKTNSSGKADLEFKPTSATQTFYLKETVAPTGYALSKDVYKIVVNSASNPSILLYKKAEGSPDYAGITTITAENARAENYNLAVTNQPTKVRIKKVAK